MDQKCHHLAAGKVVVQLSGNRGCRGVQIEPALCEEPIIVLQAESLDVKRTAVEIISNNTFLIKVMADPKTRLKTATIHWQAIAKTH